MQINDVAPLLTDFASFVSSLAPLTLSAEFLPRPGAEEYYPHREEPGVYLIADDAGGILCIGKSESKMGARMTAHLGSHPDADAAIMYPSHEWTKPSARMAAIADGHSEAVVDAAIKAVSTARIVIRTVPVTPSHWAPAIESYLIAVCCDRTGHRPVFNRKG